MGPLTFAAASDIGKVRDQNQDRWRADPIAGLYIVSDGIGGASHGELAAQIVIDLLPGYVEQTRKAATTTEGVLGTAIAQLSDELSSGALDTPDVGSTGATVVAALITGDQCTVAHLGDSRVFLLRDSQLTCLTKDHTIAQVLLDAGEITADDVAEHPGRNRLTRYVGMSAPAKPDVVHVDLQGADRLLLCTDGVSGVLDAETLRTMLAVDEDLEAACAAIIEAANNASGHDNMTALVIDAGSTSNDGPTT